VVVAQLWWRLGMVAICALCAALAPGSARARVAAHTLTVSVRDRGGAGVRGVLVTIHDAAGATELARGETAGDGLAQILALPDGALRVMVAGQLADGTPLALRGDDSRGIWVWVEGPSARLDLRVEADGGLTPDPVTMISPDGPPAEGRDLQISLPSTTPPPVVVASSPIPTAQDAGPNWAGLIILLSGLLLGALVAAWHPAGRAR
jgi:hypothetical protein